MKKLLCFLLCLAVCGTLTACGGQGASQASQPGQPSAGAPPQGSPDASAGMPVISAPAGEPAGASHILIAYFSYGENALLADGVDASTSASIQYRGGRLTGNTGVVAGMIADATGGERHRGVAGPAWAGRVI